MSRENKLKQNLIKDWTLEKWGGAIVICGCIYNDTKGRFVNGAHIHTSRVEFIDFVKGLAKTKNSVYELDMEGTAYEQRED